MPLIPENFFIQGIHIKGDYILLLLFFSYLIQIIKSRDTKINLYNGVKASFRDLVFILMIIIFIVMLVSVSYASDKSIAISESLRFLTYIMVYFIIKYEIKTEKMVTSILNSYTLATFLICAFGIIQYFTRIGLDEKFIYDTSKYSVPLRITSTLDNSNTLGAYLMIAIFPLIMIGIYEKNKSKKLIYIITSVLALITIILSFSRNAWLGILIGFTLLIIIYNWKFILLLLSGVGISILFPQVRSRAGDFKLIFGDARVNIWKLAVNMIKENPLFGVGNGNFYYQYGEYIKKYPKLQYNSYTNFQAHNSYLKVFSELGLVGIVPFIALIISILITLKSMLNKLGHEKLKAFYKGFYISVIVFIFMNIPDNLFFVPKITMNFWILVAISRSILYNNIGTRYNNFTM
jgi:O-antigen ligase